jgi:Domain of unknown function (DUF4177)
VRPYESMFVRLGQYWGSAMIGMRDRTRDIYKEVIHEHVRNGWRIVQIFASGIAAFGAANYFELIIERDGTEDPTATWVPEGNRR